MATLTIKKKDGTEIEVNAQGVQAPPKIHGSLSLNGIPMLASEVNLNETVNPATGQPYVQAGLRSTTQIQAPPQNFSRRIPARG
jgi:hypothetical protein